jgi:hypothetical protein
MQHFRDALVAGVLLRVMRKSAARTNRASDDFVSVQSKGIPHPKREAWVCQSRERAQRCGELFGDDGVEEFTSADSGNCNMAGNTCSSPRRHDLDVLNFVVEVSLARTERARGLPGSCRTDRHEAYNSLGLAAFAGLNNTRFVGVYFLNPPFPAPCGFEPHPGHWFTSLLRIQTNDPIADPLGRAQAQPENRLRGRVERAHVSIFLNAIRKFLVRNGNLSACPNRKATSALGDLRCFNFGVDIG